MARGLENRQDISSRRCGSKWTGLDCFASTTTQQIDDSLRWSDASVLSNRASKRSEPLSAMLPLSRHHTERPCETEGVVATWLEQENGNTVLLRFYTGSGNSWSWEDRTTGKASRCPGTGYRHGHNRHTSQCSRSIERERCWIWGKLLKTCDRGHWSDAAFS